MESRTEVCLCEAALLPGTEVTEEVTLVSESDSVEPWELLDARLRLRGVGWG